jgi:hypothetical protein
MLCSFGDYGEGTTVDGENELLPGERLLWSGRPARATITQAGLIMAAYPVVILVVATAFEFRVLKHMGTFRIVAIFVWASCVLSVAWSSIVVLLIQPANLRRSAYQVTNWRILVTSGWRRPQTRGVYLDQIDEPVLSRDRDLLLRTATASEGSGVQMVIARSRTRSPFGLGPTAPPAMLTAVDDARHVRDLIATARQAMLDDTAAARPGRPDERGLARRRPAGGGRAGALDWASGTVCVVAECERHQFLGLWLLLRGVLLPGHRHNSGRQAGRRPHSLARCHLWYLRFHRAGPAAPQADPCLGVRAD